MKYPAAVEMSENALGAYVSDLPGCGVVAETRDEALELIRKAVALHLESLREEGSPIPEPVTTTKTCRYNLIWREAIPRQRLYAAKEASIKAMAT
jgi:predicted RNase H-like HicB family nuclease